MTAIRSRSSIQAVLLSGALAAGLVGGAETLLLWWGARNPGLDLATLRFGLVGYPLAGALLALVVWPVGRGLARLTGSDLFPWRLRVEGPSAWLRAWLLTNVLLWLALVGGVDLARLALGVPPGSVPGLLVLAGSAVAALALGRLLVPRFAGRGRASIHPAKPAAGVGVILAAGLLLPVLLESAVYGVAERPARIAAFHNRESAGPQRLAAREPAGPPAPQRPDVVLVSLDTTRADHLTPYGYEHDTTPRLAEFAAEAVRFDNAWAASSWTVPSHATMFTGRFPHSHGARYKTGAEVSEELDVSSAQFHTKIRPLDPERVTLAEVLAAHGYRTGATVGGPYLMAEFGMAQGFEWYDDRLSTSVAPRLALYYGLERAIARLAPSWRLEPDLVRFGHGYRRADEITRSASGWLDAQGDDRVFLFVNYFDAHYPLWPVRAHRTRFPGSELDADPANFDAVYAAVMKGERGLLPEEKAWISSQYDAELRYQDEWMGALFDRLKAAGRWDESLVIVTADHGEHMGETHGDDQVHLQHGFTVYAPVTHIPLLVKFPESAGVAPGAYDHAVHLADLMPTVLGRLGLDFADYEDPQGPMQGRALLDTSAPHVALSELYRDDWRVERFGGRWGREIRAWLDGTLRVHRLQAVDAEGNELGGPGAQLFDLASDPLEASPLDPALHAPGSLLESMDAWLGSAAAFLASEYLKSWRGPSEDAQGQLDGTGYAGGEQADPGR